jgi:hypothetical protein
MKLIGPVVILLSFLPTLVVRGASAQGGIVLTVVDSLSGAPIPAAIVTSLRLHRVEHADRLGRIRFSELSRPDTLVAASIGFRPETLVVATGIGALTVRLQRPPITLAEVTVTADRHVMLSPTAVGEWILPRQAIANVPVAVEPDPLRSLAIVPSVSFSSPLSGRPIIRGYDAAESVIRIDGFEILNPYHIGRVFSGFPADATESIAIAAVPARVADGGTLAGVVDLRGRSGGDRTSSTAGAELTLVSVTGWWGARGAVPVFAAVRGAWLGAAVKLTGKGAPYDFQDFYLRTGLGLGGRRAVDVTAYASRDHLGDLGREGAEWSNALLGQRWRLVDEPGGSLDVIASANRFALSGTRLPARASVVDVTNRFTRLSLAIDGTLRRGAVELRSGLSMGSRAISNVVLVRGGDDFVPEMRESSLIELATFVEARWAAGPWLVDGGVRLDASPTARGWQPRARLGRSLGQHATVAVAAARSARLYQLITDAQPEPAIAFYDFWRNAGDSGVPVPRVDHLAAEFDGSGRSWTTHFALFLSRGSGLGELRPVSDQRTGVTTFRFGDSRTRGIESRTTWRPTPGGWAVALTYVLSESERRWDDGVWRPWRLDRRHTARLQLDGPLGKRWYAFGAGEFASGQPITPVQEVVRILGDTVAGFTPLVPLGYLYGPEGIGRSAPTFHFDVGARVRFTGPGGSALLIGLSVINLGFGPVAPQVPEELFPYPGYGNEGVVYRRLFAMPAVPSITGRIEF